MGSLDLASEIRIVVYHEISKDGRPIQCYSIDGNRKKRMFRPNLTAQILRSCSTVYTEAKAILFELNAFHLTEPGDLALLRSKAGPLAARITAISSRVPAMLNMNALLKLRVFTSLTSIALLDWSDHFYCPYPFTKRGLEMILVSHINEFHNGVLSILLLLPNIRYELLASDAVRPDEVSIPEGRLEYPDLLTGWGHRKSRSSVRGRSSSEQNQHRPEAATNAA